MVELLQEVVPANPIAPTESVEDEGQAVAWTEIEPGRYMPRRTRGSCKGRALG